MAKKLRTMSYHNQAPDKGNRAQLLGAVAEALAGAAGLGMSMGELAKRVGVSRPTLYYHFNDKTEIMTSLVEDLIESTSSFIDGVDSAQFTSASEMLFELCRVRTVSILERRYNFQLLVYLDRNLPAEVQGAHEALKRRILATIQGAIESGIASGEFAPCDPKASALAMIGMGNWVAWWFDERYGRIEDIAENLARQAVQSLTTGNEQTDQGQAVPKITSRAEALVALEAAIAYLKADSA